MHALYRNVFWAALRSLFWIFKTPIVAGITLARVWVARFLLKDTIFCRTCGNENSLMGLWECASCGYSFYGFYFSRCEVCGSVPPYLDCGRCGASTRNPILFG